MKQFGSANDVLDFAISEEDASASFYKNLAAKMDKPHMREIFNEFAKEEEGHKAKLQNIKEGGTLEASAEKVVDLKIGDYLVDVMPSSDMNYQDALLLAMKKEKSAFRLYSDLAGVCTDENLCNVFGMLAQEEAKHKLRFEVEYDEYILTEN
ncbi:MAG: rubrerythrin [Planctomycetota bacterium]|nr:MAG: rubrerythrin [Planctomycetota bacterium]